MESSARKSCSSIPTSVLFPGTSRTLVENASQDSVMSRSLSHSEKYVLDKNAVAGQPKEKVSFAKKWEWRPKGEESHLKLGSVSLLDTLMNLKWKEGAMTESEIHVIYLPHIPVENYRKYNIVMKLNFEGAEDEDEKVIAKAEFPSPLHMHVIFYPGHSFSLKRGSMYPWSIEVTTNAPINDKYTLADIYVHFKAYNTPASHYTEKRGANIISLVPITEIPTGVIFTRPRVGEWKVSSLQYGIRQEKDVKVLQAMQEAGVDIEALQSLGILSTVVSRTKKLLSAGPESVKEPIHKAICKEALSALSKKMKN